MLAAGMKGVENNYDLPDPIEENIFHMSAEKKAGLDVDVLPDSLENAIIEFEKSALMKKTLGQHVFDKLLENKRIEWDAYRTKVTNYEIDKYLPML